MTPLAKGVLSLAGVLGVSAAVVLVVLNQSRGTGAGTPTGTGPKIVIDNGVVPGADALRPDYRVELLSITPFSQTDQDGRSVTNEVFTGRVTVVSFFFTRCTFICPALTGTMLELMQRLKDTSARFVSFTVDPEHDTPEVLKKYAQDHQADLGRWTLVSGKKEETWGMLRQGLKWGIEERPEERINLPGGASISNIRHPGWLALIGPDGRVLGIYQSSDDEQIKALETRVRTALKRMSDKG